MSAKGIQATALTVRQLLTRGHYEVPVYQRNYAWGEEEIRQLVDDLLDAATDSGIDKYFLGNIVVSAGSNKTTPSYSLIDGQQRLTTFHLLFRYLLAQQDLPDLLLNQLQFESRPRAKQALASLNTDTPGDDLDPGIINGFRIIEQYSETKRLLEHFPFILDRVLVARLELPADTVLNRYFEVMNTRGEQLQQEDIVKARMMSALACDAARTTFAWVWDACAVMDRYIQLALTPGDPNLRAKLFDPSWQWLRVETFDGLTACCPSATSESGTVAQSPSLDAAIMNYASAGQVEGDDKIADETFRSIIQFPVFLLHVLRIVEGKSLDEAESALDDKRLISRFTAYLSSDDAEMRAKQFALALLKCRLLFDSLILKRESTLATGDEGVWSLKRCVKGEDRSRRSVSFVPRYVGSFPLDRSGSFEGEASDDSEISKRIRLIQAALRVTYTSPRTMHWITHLLDFAFHTPSTDLKANDVLVLLEKYAVGKLAPVFRAGELLVNGFEIPRIVFTYLDYLLAIRSRDLDFQFTFRNSIEHFYPQSPDNELIRAYGAIDEPGTRDLLGNLALLTVRDNSKFTNLPPYIKSDSVRIVEQSPKLKQMAAVAKQSPVAWDSNSIREHHDSMVSILWSEIERHRLAV